MYMWATAWRTYQTKTNGTDVMMMQKELNIFFQEMSVNQPAYIKNKLYGERTVLICLAPSIILLLS